LLLTVVTILGKPPKKSSSSSTFKCYSTDTVGTWSITLSMIALAWPPSKPDIASTPAEIGTLGATSIYMHSKFAFITVSDTSSTDTLLSNLLTTYRLQYFKLSLQLDASLSTLVMPYCLWDPDKHVETLC
jgi:hypothetical protein